MTAYIDARYQLPIHAQSRALQGVFDRLLPDGRKLSLIPALFGAGRIGVSEKPPFTGLLHEGWDYLDYWHAFAQFVVWNGEGEPDGWSRHISSGRYRIDGIPELEYVKFDEGTIEFRIEKAILATQGQDRRILQIKEAVVGKQYPEGTRLFYVDSDHILYDDHRCMHFDDSVYLYLDRVVVLGLKDIMNGLVKTVLTRLTGQNTH